MRRSHTTPLVLLAALSLIASACGGSAVATPGATTTGTPQATATGAGSTATPGATGGATTAPAETATPAPPTGAVIRAINVEPTQGFDPNIAAADASRIPMSFMFDNLVDYDEQGDLTGAIAESWEPSNENKTWTFKLRQGAKFSDGSEITADDVKWSIDRMRQGEIMKGLLSNVTDVSIKDPSTIVVTLSAPSRALPLALSRHGSAAILSRKAVEGNPDYFAKPTATSGPYVLTELVPKSHAMFEANRNYWRAGYPRNAGIRYTFSEDQNAWAAAVESGSVDVANVGYADAQRLKQGGTIPVEQADLLTPLFWGWNVAKPPFDDKRVRQAVAYAVDRQGRIDACWFGTGAVTYGNILRPWDPYYTEINRYQTASREEALQKAGELLDQAGWTMGADGIRAKGGEKFSLKVPYEGNWPAAECNTLLLQSTLKPLGIDIQPEKYDPAPFWGDVTADKFTMYHGGAGATGAEDLYLNWFRSGGALTPLTTHLENKEIDAKIDAAVSAPDEATAKAAFRELEEWQAEELPMLVTGFQWPQVAMNPKLQGYYSRPDGSLKWLLNATLAE
jgi:peptide/nickel transport system substrate-binding protein